MYCVRDLQTRVICIAHSMYARLYRLSDQA